MSKNLAQQRREEIIHAAHKCFVTKGFHATGMADIAREFGMSAGHIYNYFPSKTAIIEEVISRGMEDFYKNSCALQESQGSYQFDMNDDNGKYGRMHLQDSYNTDDENEEVPCFFLDPDKGCTLSYEDKPFDCKIWPLRIMKKDDEYVIALTPTCPSIGKEPSDELQKLVDDGLGDIIYDYAKTHPFIIKDYKEGFPVLMVRK